jgi:hypothetical protein
MLTTRAEQMAAGGDQCGKGSLRLLGSSRFGFGH